jgi:hypothetical protein
MYSEKELIKMFEEDGLECYNTSFDDENIIMIDIGLEGILKFAKKRKLKEVFYRFDYSSKEVLSITEEDMRRTMEKVDIPYEEICNVIAPMTEEYNAKVAKLDFTKPHSLTVFGLYQGQKIGIFESDFWFFEEEVTFPEEAIKLIVAENEDLIKKHVIEKEEQSIKIKEEFHQYLLNDEKFHKCTNASLRTTYKMELYKDNEHQNLKKAFIKGTEYQCYNEYAEFIEMVWREYKENLKKKSNSPYLNYSGVD